MSCADEVIMTPFGDQHMETTWFSSNFNTQFAYLLSTKLECKVRLIYNAIRI